jgi:decaprenylphospho-beta-D-ribofuranose 2-oxidase
MADVTRETKGKKVEFRPRLVKAGRTPSRGNAVEMAGWGCYPVIRGYERRSENLAAITRDAVLTRGLGRAYGDACLPPAGDYTVAASPLADRLLAFDPEAGVVRVEAGFPLMRLNRMSLPRGWFTPVTPGTHYVTVGGMVASDVHGKNHHVAGCFGEHVRALKMRVAGGSIIECGDAKSDLFRATLGGMGLTGHILEVEFQMQRVPSPWIWEESERIDDFATVLEKLEEAGREWPFTVCWSDFLVTGASAGRAILMKGRWAGAGEAPAGLPKWRSTVTFPVRLPSWALQAWMMRIGNFLNYSKHGASTRSGIAHPETFFYPLDVIGEWNRIYGRRGFTQHQAVLPAPHTHRRHEQFLRLLHDNRAKVFLSVVKDCGDEGRGMISFPKRGVSYALDIPIDQDTQRLVDRLNDFVAAEGGRIYLAKDAFTRPEHFRAMEPRLEAWSAVRRQWDPECRLKSALSVRVLGDPA